MKIANVLIVGSGIAALQLARTLKEDLNVMVLTKSTTTNGNSHMAQGGVAAALGVKDHPNLHYLDTLEAGRNHNDSEAVKELTEEAPDIIEELLEAGCSFDFNENGHLKLGMEGAHSEKRIVHSGGDATGKAIVEFLVSQLGSHITVQENVFVYELIVNVEGQCIGVKGKLRGGKTEYYYADHVVLATGGCGQLYHFTSNAETVTGDGLALAYLAGAELVDMEFIQFHPTLLYVDGHTKGLISEAVRGEGARLVTEEGTFIMEDVHPLKDLAPRHIVSQTIYEYLKLGKPIYLDISKVENFTERFPTVSAICRESGVELASDRLPVAPGSHFLMGGVKTDRLGRTNIAGLYAIGEVACTGVHGANRLASNSLLEGLVYGKRLGNWLNAQSELKVIANDNKAMPFEGPASLTPAQKENLSLPDKHILQQTMMDRTGIVRHNGGLTMQKNWLESYRVEDWVETSLDDYSTEEMNSVFMLITSWLITNAALVRTESRGGHYRADFPMEDHANWFKNQIVYKRKIKKDGLSEQIKTALTT
ncbi:L-aspartate oxidase [Mesobacillus maritimus]|uniref:L-aspartate oxidase n=2 Tax=Mesobacillus maritimus TaxID=1643336 RepID=A0ABS7K1V5_9BACI|nr:L-aspartate oxidase [Mesobacillus maritimus]MBY0096238.1 L-aspartate oxidase [Mesobacillus maritimus]